jgi:hypothetical protein
LTSLSLAASAAGVAAAIVATISANAVGDTAPASFLTKTGYAYTASRTSPARIAATIVTATPADAIGYTVFDSFSTKAGYTSLVGWTFPTRTAATIVTAYASFAGRLAFSLLFLLVALFFIVFVTPDKKEKNPDLQKYPRASFPTTHDSLLLRSTSVCCEGN